MVKISVPDIPRSKPSHCIPVNIERDMIESRITRAMIRVFITAVVGP